MKGDWIDNALKPPEPELFWNPRGRAIPVVDKRRIREFIQQGFVRCQEGTKEGAYNPIYDRGDGVAAKEIIQNTPFHRIQEQDTNHLDLLEL